MNLSKVGDIAIWVLNAAESMGNYATAWKQKLRASERLRDFDARAKKAHDTARATVVEAEPRAPSSSTSRPSSRSGSGMAE